MNLRATGHALLLAALLATIALIFAPQLPGTWLQWAALAVLLLFAGAAASSAADEQGGP